MSSDFAEIPLDRLQNLMRKNDVTKLLVKELAANDNAKNQLYLSGSLEEANIIPFGEVRVDETQKGNKILKAPLSFSWLQSDGEVTSAPRAQIILYPQYPEVRLSGFLRGTTNAPNYLLNNRAEGRLLFLGITSDQKIVACAVGGHSALARQYRSLGDLETIGVFKVIPLSKDERGKSTREQLLKELRRIHLLGWIKSKALGSDGSERECAASNCVGYTLEAELGVARNGRAEPDYKGWEIKAGIVQNFSAQPTAKAITLMTPEPTGGFYRTSGVGAFVRRFGYEDKKGRVDRYNFGGVYRAGERHPGTKLTLKLSGYDIQKCKITNPGGMIALVTDRDIVAAEWSFAALMTLWNKKHAQAVYVPARSREHPSLQYRYGQFVRIADGTSIERLLGAIAAGYVYYDPGIKLENASTTSPRTKRRSQFRIGSRNLAILYRQMEQISVT
jgi:hypothetical protein